MGFFYQLCFDVAANIGQTSLTVLTHFPNAEVNSFEPHPDTSICGFWQPFGFRFVTCYTDAVVTDGSASRNRQIT
jgi:hypothetical protein